jgi:hypothetical protein
VECRSQIIPSAEGQFLHYLHYLKRRNMSLFCPIHHYDQNLVVLVSPARSPPPLGRIFALTSGPPRTIRTFPFHRPNLIFLFPSCGASVSGLGFHGAAMPRPRPHLTPPSNPHSGATLYASTHPRRRCDHDSSMAPRTRRTHLNHRVHQRIIEDALDLVVT